LAASLDSNYSAEDILEVYRLRWQIELLFKRIKQNLKIQSIRKGSENYALAMVYLRLIVRSIIEQAACKALYAFSEYKN
jgi:IS4 transposase